MKDEGGRRKDGGFSWLFLAAELAAGGLDFQAFALAERRVDAEFSQSLLEFEDCCRFGRLQVRRQGI